MVCDEWKWKCENCWFSSEHSQKLFFFLYIIFHSALQKKIILRFRDDVWELKVFINNFSQCIMFCVFVVLLSQSVGYYILHIHMISNFKWFHVLLLSYHRCAIYDMCVAGAVVSWIKLLMIATVWHCRWVHEKNERENDGVEWIWAAVC